MSDQNDDLLHRAARLDDETREVLSGVAASLDRSAAAQEAVAQELALVRPGLERGLRASWVALAALALVVVSAIGGGTTWFVLYQRGACERGNSRNAASIDLANKVVFETSRDVAPDEPVEVARARAERVADRVGEDPRLAPREC